MRYQLSKICAASGVEIAAKQNEKAIELARARHNEAVTHLSDADTEQREYDKIKNWANLYDSCTFAAKKMIMAQFIKAVYVYRDYTLEIEFNVSFEDFKAMATECQDQGPHEQPRIYITA